MRLRQHGKLGNTRGFSLIEVTVTVLIALALSAIALPAILRAWNAYRLNSAIRDINGLVKRTRFEAVRQNTVVNLLLQQQQGNTWLLGIDLNKNGVIDTTEPQVLLAGPVQLLPAASVPSPKSMGAAYATAAVPWANCQPSAANCVSFDSRGAVNYGGGAPVVYAVYAGFLQPATNDYRAITVLPTGTTKIWTCCDANGGWGPGS